MQAKSGMMKPAEIEAGSFGIIRGELAMKGFTPAPEVEDILLRVIHTTADFDYAETLTFTNDAATRIRQALREGADLVTDTEMAKAGINRKALAKTGGSVHCFMGDPDVAKEAEDRGVTRASVSMERAAELTSPCVFAIGNAPTALLRIHELMLEGRLRPAGIIAVPVGFVNVVEAKDLILGDPVPCIAARGRKGGSTVAAAICNALLYSCMA